MAAQPQRAKIDPKVKTDVVNRIMSKQLTFERAIKEFELQPYQLYAWLGQHALKERVNGISSNTGDTSMSLPVLKMPDGPDGATPDIDDEFVRMTGYWYLRRQGILK